MTSPTSLENELAFFRVAIDGAWTVDEFARLLTDLSDVYLRLSTVDFFVRAIQREDQENHEFRKANEYRKIDPRMRNLYFGFGLRGHDGAQFIEPEPFGALISVAARYTGGVGSRKPVVWISRLDRSHWKSKSTEGDC